MGSILTRSRSLECLGYSERDVQVLAGLLMVAGLLFLFFKALYSARLAAKGIRDTAESMVGLTRMCYWLFSVCTTTATTDKLSLFLLLCLCLFFLCASCVIPCRCCQCMNGSSMPCVSLCLFVLSS